MFIDFSIKDLIDILLVAYLLYQTYRLMKDSGSINIFIGILVFIGIDRKSTRLNSSHP